MRSELLGTAGPVKGGEEGRVGERERIRRSVCRRRDGHSVLRQRVEERADVVRRQAGKVGVHDRDDAVESIECLPHGRTLTAPGICYDRRRRWDHCSAPPRPLVGHSRTSYQWVSRSASATFGSVCCALKTLWSRSQQMATASSGTSGRLASASPGSFASATV